MEQYYYTIKSSKNDILKVVAYLLDGHYPEEYETINEVTEENDFEDYEVTVDADGEARVELFDVCYMDLENVFDDPSDRMMFEKMSYIAAIIENSGDFEVAFTFEDSRAGYSHFGTCRFDGKKLNYTDTVIIEPHEPIDHAYSADLSNGKLINEVYEGWFHFSGEEAPDEIPREYYGL